MIKIKIVRKISGKKIRQIERRIRLKQVKPTFGNTPNYQRNKVIGAPKKDNPNLYKGEESKIRSSTRDIRIPSKKRKGALKRFKKHFPNVVVKAGTVRKLGARTTIEVATLDPKPKKIINK